MAKIYSFAERKFLYDSNDMFDKNESVYEERLDDGMKSVISIMKEFREESADYDPMSSIVLVPSNLKENWSFISMDISDTRATIISALESALVKAKGMSVDAW